MINKIVLGSSSPRRKEILSMLGLPYEVVVPDTDESSEPAESPEKYVCVLAKAKCDAVAQKLIGQGKNIADTLIISCDTIVYYDGFIIGKPESEMHAKLTLGMLSDSWHTVYSGLCLRCGEQVCEDFCTTKVKFAELSRNEIDEYVKTGEPMGKAGSYAAQLRGSSFVERIDGDFFNVMGLPVSTLCKMIKTEFNTDVFELSKRLSEVRK